ncbi:hypothetical protein J3L16_15880, partial [Alteromonas sp. 5E99-2]|uniref:hypothetical protein n=1 Tax=Alteromonas sp. 5E99-2 TaxID=2817683 RepID=UPI001A9880A6
MSINEVQLAKKFINLHQKDQVKLLNKLKQHELNFLDLPIVKSTADHVDNIPLSYAQTGLWLTWQLNPESAAYNMSGV